MVHRGYAYIGHGDGAGVGGQGRKATGLGFFGSRRER
jgi:hypothetical protein